MDWYWWLYLADHIIDGYMWQLATTLAATGYGWVYVAGIDMDGYM